MKSFIALIGLDFNFQMSWISMLSVLEVIGFLSHSKIPNPFIRLNANFFDIPTKRWKNTKFITIVKS
ncbi:hypothetical protein ACLF8P_00380 [Helicobacter pylori]